MLFFIIMCVHPQMIHVKFMRKTSNKKPQNLMFFILGFYRLSPPNSLSPPPLPSKPSGP